MIRLNASFRPDLGWWHVFASSWNGVLMLKGRRVHNRVVEVWSDASGSWGCGAVWEVQWIQVEWKELPSFAHATIAPKELLLIVVAMAIWGHVWSGSHVICHCDRMLVVAALTGGYCREESMAHMLRCSIFLEAKFDLTLSAVHVPGVENTLADAISRNNLDVFFDLCPQAHRQACSFPSGSSGSSG